MSCKLYLPTVPYALAKRLPTTLTVPFARPGPIARHPHVGAKYQGSIICPAKADITDGDYVRIIDGVGHQVDFEWDVAGDGVTSGRIPVDISTYATAEDVSDVLLTAIQSVVEAGGLRLTCWDSVAAAAVVLMFHDVRQIPIIVAAGVSGVKFTVGDPYPYPFPAVPLRWGLSRAVAMIGLPYATVTPPSGTEPR